MKDIWIPVMTDGQISGRYKWTTHWFYYENNLDQIVLLEIFDDKHRCRVRHHIHGNEFYQGSRMHMNFESLMIRVTTIHGKEIFTYKSNRNDETKQISKGNGKTVS